MVVIAKGHGLSPIWCQAITSTNVEFKKKKSWILVNLLLRNSLSKIWMKYTNLLTHSGRMIGICVGYLTIIGSDNGLSPHRRQAIIWTNAGILLIGPLGTIFGEILSKILTFSFTQMHLKLSSAKRQPVCLNVLTKSVLFTVPMDDPALREMAEYMEANRDELMEKLPGNNHQVTLLLYRDGDQLKFCRFLDMGDGTLTPLSESLR